MPLQYQVDSLEGVEESVQALYTKTDDGKFRLGVDGLPDVSKLERALHSEREARSAAEKETKRLLRDHTDHELVASVTTLKAERDAERARAEQATAAAAAARGVALELHVRSAAKAAGVFESAVPDAVRAAREQFDLGDDGAVTPRDAAGRFTSLDAWMLATREVSPHWFPATGSGGGAVQSTHSGGTSNTIRRSAFEALAAPMKAAALAAGLRIVD